METIGYILTIIGGSMLGIVLLCFFAWGLQLVVYSIREKEYDLAMVTLFFLSIIIGMAGVVCLVLSGHK